MRRELGRRQRDHVRRGRAGREEPAHEQHDRIQRKDAEHAPHGVSRPARRVGELAGTDREPRERQEKGAQHEEEIHAVGTGAREIEEHVVTAIREMREHDEQDRDPAQTVERVELEVGRRRLSEKSASRTRNRPR